MPLYNFHCNDCGEFYLFRSIDTRNDPAACPECSADASRLILAPNLSIMSPSVRRAHSVNERSRHEPKISGTHTCSSSCGCGTGKKVKPTLTRETKLGKLNASRATSRPWMLGH